MIDYVVRVVNSQMTSKERVLVYTRITHERGQGETKTPPKNWSHAGVIEFKDVSLWYYTHSSNALNSFIHLNLFSHGSLSIYIYIVFHRDLNARKKSG